jgi:hypothetical protein
MLRYLFKKLGKLLLPERGSGDGARSMEPVDVLLLLYQRISRLAEQIESHADFAPYPQVTERLCRIAAEKHDISNRLKEIIENLHGSIREPLQPQATGKNHWQRLIRDLEEQEAIDDLLSRYEFTLIRQVPGITDFLQDLRSIHERHRKFLVQLIAMADPQANQT